MIARARQLIVEHPMLAVGGAFAAGALAAFGRPRGRISGAVAGVLGTLAIRVVRDLAMGKASEYARHWIDQRERTARDAEAFYEH